MEKSEDAPSGGTRLGRYVLEGRLASGGMADVYRAHALGPAGVRKDICIKRVARDVVGEGRALERFVDEARLSMLLDHGNIVTVFDFGRADDGYYLAMEWVDGVDLADLIADSDTPLPTGVVAHVGSEIARALQHAHENGRAGRIVHRDVKPSNVLLSRAGEVKLGDFGIAEIAGESRTIAGTRGYMAPEQERGDVARPAADLFGLGRVLLELAAGRRVPIEDSVATLATIDPALAAIVRPMLAEAPEDRPESARVVAAQLEKLSSVAIAQGAEAPRDVLAARVAKALRGRAPLARNVNANATFESFALTETNAPSDSVREAPTVDRRPPRSEPRERAVGRRLAYAGLALALVVGTGVGLRTWIATRTSARPAANVAPATPTTNETNETNESPAQPVVPAARTDVAPPEPEATRATSPAATSAAARRPTTPTTVERATPRTAETTNGGEPTTAAVSSTAPEPRVATGTLDLSARPWARVFLDDRAVGVTPIFGLEVRAGTHVVRFENEELGLTRALSVEVGENARRRVSVDLR